jgi:hypothetical protein
MKRNFGALLELLGNRLQVALQEPNPINRCLGCVRAAESAIAQMKEEVLADPFLSREEEIHHFKHEAPELYSQLFYYLCLVQIESDRPYADPDCFQASLRLRKEQLDEYFRLHDHICRYYNQGCTFQDDHLFLRRPTGQWSGDEIGAFIPPDFTIGAHWISWIKANDRVRNFVREELARLSGQQPRIQWTGNRADAIVAFRALHLAGCFSKNTLKEVMEWVQDQLGVKTGQFHVALNEASIRKDPVAFLRKLIDLLTQKFDSMLD